MTPKRSDRTGLAAAAVASGDCAYHVDDVVERADERQTGKVAEHVDHLVGLSFPMPCHTAAGAEPQRRFERSAEPQRWFKFHLKLKGLLRQRGTKRDLTFYTCHAMPVPCCVDVRLQRAACRALCHAAPCTLSCRPMHSVMPCRAPCHALPGTLSCHALHFIRPCLASLPCGAVSCSCRGHQIYRP